jgi:hypothetical protein
MPLSLERDSTLPLECNVLQRDVDEYKRAIAKTIERNIELLKELPPPKNFTIEEIVEHFKKKIKADLEKDTYFEERVEVGIYAHSMFDSMSKYFAKIHDLNKEEKEKNSYAIFSVSRLFLNSNLSDDFFKTISSSYLIENDFLDLFDTTIRTEHVKLISYKSQRVKFERVCNKHNAWVHKFTEKLNLIGKNRTKLIWYVEIANSNKLEELFKDKFIKKENIDQKILTKLINAVTETTTQLEKLVLTNFNNHHLLTDEIDDNIKTLTDLMNALPI